MKQTIHNGYTIDRKTIPPTAKHIYSGDTLQETVDYVASMGGGIYENILHRFQFKVGAK